MLGHHEASLHIRHTVQPLNSLLDALIKWSDVFSFSDKKWRSSDSFKGKARKAKLRGWLCSKKSKQILSTQHFCLEAWLMLACILSALFTHFIVTFLHIKKFHYYGSSFVATGFKRKYKSLCFFTMPCQL